MYFCSGSTQRYSPSTLYILWRKSEGREGEKTFCYFMKNTWNHFCFLKYFFKVFQVWIVETHSNRIEIQCFILCDA